MLEIIKIPEFEKELRKKSRDLTKQEILSKEMQEFFDDLLYTLRFAESEEFVTNVGLAATQVNKHVSVLGAMNVKTEKIKLYINPKIEVLDHTPIIKNEGCLSIPNLTGPVARPKQIKVTYLDRRAISHTVTLSGFNARVVLHEYDHLQGILFIDKLANEPKAKDMYYA